VDDITPGYPFFIAFNNFSSVTLTITKSKTSFIFLTAPPAISAVPEPQTLPPFFENISATSAGVVAEQ
jgi:hypothetical protein